jgi:hypothetical protein
MLVRIKLVTADSEAEIEHEKVFNFYWQYTIFLDMKYIK